MLRYQRNQIDCFVEGSQIFRLALGEELVFSTAEVGYIYGQGFNHHQPYPLSKKPFFLPKFAVNNINAPLWFCSKGLVILAETEALLEIEMTAGEWPTLSIKAIEQEVTIHLWRGKNIKAAHQQFLLDLNRKYSLPGHNFIGDSLFCTWSQFPRCINQQRVLDFAAEIREHQYPCSTIIIDDRWEKAYGDLAFADMFPDPRAMVETLHRQGFRVLLWVTPFINKDSLNFSFLEQKGWLVRSKTQGAALLNWWGGQAGLIDLTCPEASAWYEEQLQKLKVTCQIDGFKIDGGDAKYQPNPEESLWHDYKGASGFSDLLLEVFEKVSPGLCETRTAWLSQNRNIVWRLGGKDSHWGEDNGLKALVHLGIQLSLMGYDFLIPDMVGGRIQTMSQTDPLVTDELFIRFCEVSAFMPVLQFSYYPWNYHRVVWESCLVLAKAHKALGVYIEELVKDKNHLLIQPLWYQDDDERAFELGDEFLLGPDILVCPVLSSGQVVRDIYFPQGQWIDVYNQNSFMGPLEIENYPAPCPGIPIFVRAGQEALRKTLMEIMSPLTSVAILPEVTTATYESGINRDIKVTG